MNTHRIAATIAVLLLAVSPTLHATCSNASLRGTYGYFSQGFIPITADISPALFVPQAQTGLITFDGKGLVTSGTFTINTTDPAGGAARGTFTGTYLVNSDCTGTVETMLSDNRGIFHYDLVVLNSTEFVAISSDTGGSLIYSAKKIRIPKER